MEFDRSGEVYFERVLDLPLASATALSAAVILRLVWLAAELILAGILYFFVRRSAQDDVDMN